MKAEMDVGTNRKAFQINLDRQKYGTLPEIGAGQEVARRFFTVGGAADTVAARSFKQHNESHGWVGIRFQPAPRSEPSQIIIHVRMLDESNVDQQEALGVVGVNLLYGAFYHSEPERLISSLQENLAPGKIQVDLIKFSGPAFANIDNRLMSLQLVSQGLTDAVMFTADGEMVQPSEILHKKAILIERGSFLAVNYSTNDRREGARGRFSKERGCQ